MHNAITASGTEHWEILSDELRDVFDQIADEHAANWEEIVDGLYEEHVPPPPASPWETLEAALHEAERTVDATRWIPASSTFQTVRPVARAS